VRCKQIIPKSKKVRYLVAQSKQLKKKHVVIYLLYKKRNSKHAAIQSFTEKGAPPLQIAMTSQSCADDLP
jgi:hypothetical protein